jgi:hypothetical protein
MMAPHMVTKNLESAVATADAAGPSSVGGGVGAGVVVGRAARHSTSFTLEGTHSPHVTGQRLCTHPAGAPCDVIHESFRHKLSVALPVSNAVNAAQFSTSPSLSALTKSSLSAHSS